MIGDKLGINHAYEPLFAFMSDFEEFIMAFFYLFVLFKNLSIISFSFNSF